MFSSDSANYSWYYTVNFWAPAWAEQVYAVFPEEGMVVMNLYRQLFVIPVYSFKCDHPQCHVHHQTHTVRSGTSRSLFLREDWSMRRKCFVYDNVVLVVNFTHHSRELLMSAQNLFLL